MNVAGRDRDPFGAKELNLIGFQDAAALRHNRIADDRESIGLGVVDGFVAGDVYRLRALGAGSGSAARKSSGEDRSHAKQQQRRKYGDIERFRPVLQEITLSSRRGQESTGRFRR